MKSKTGWEVMIPTCSQCGVPLIVYKDEVWKFYTCEKCGAKFPMRKEVPGAREWFINKIKEDTGVTLK